jgi:hypothetical protein
MQMLVQIQHLHQILVVTVLQVVVVVLVLLEVNLMEVMV